MKQGLTLIWLALGLGSASPSRGETLAVTDPTALARLEGAGLSIGRQLGPELASDLKEQIGFDLDAAARQVRASPPFPGLIELFPRRWLTGEGATWPLAAVVHRFDLRRRAETPCGEVRLIYRLSGPNGRRPLAVMLVHSAAAALGTTDCKAVARALQLPEEPSPARIVAAYLGRGAPGERLARGASPVLRVELNLQLGRWPTTDDERFSDQSHYLMRVYAPDATRRHLGAQPLENTPDVARLAADAAARDALRTWLARPEAREAARAGTLVVPETYLATRSLSVAPYGLARLANRPFTAALGLAENLPDQRRLDTLSCAGCHEGRGIAGFHVLGFEPNPAAPDFTLAWPFSAYYERVQEFRKAEILAYLADKPPPRLPDAERSGDGDLGDACGLTPGFATWRCKGGLACDARPSGEAGVGECVPGSAAPGSPCDAARLSTHFASLGDRYIPSKIESCGAGGICAPARAGFPGGFCAAECKAAGDALCTPVPTLGPFTACVVETGDFRACARRHNLPVAMPRCHDNRDCRRDYACINSAAREGFCAPPYLAPELTLTASPSR